MLGQFITCMKGLIILHVDLIVNEHGENLFAGLIPQFLYS